MSYAWFCSNDLDLCVFEADYKDELLGLDPTLASTHLNASSRIDAVVDHWGAVYAVDAVQVRWGAISHFLSRRAGGTCHSHDH